MIVPASQPLYSRLLSSPRLLILWVLAIIAIPVWAHFDTAGWDVAIYGNAVHSLRAGHDPYADAIAVQRRYHAEPVHTPGEGLPYSYVYSPITLPVLRAIALLPDWLIATLYWATFIVASFATLWFGWQLVLPHEQDVMQYVLPVTPFLPGLLANGSLLGGNIAFILYAAVLLLALRGWRRGAWLGFYVAVVVASCIKAPLLTLLAIPVLSARRQWLPAAAAAAISIALFTLQPLVWPSLFHNYLQAVELQFSFNADFGCSPAGLISELLFRRGLPYSPTGPIVYLCYAVPVALTLYALSRRFLAHRFLLEEWVPVLLTGVILLNPRIQEYDAAPLTVSLALIALRFIRSAKHRTATLWIVAAAFILCNAAALYSWELRKALDGPLLVLCFAWGAVSLTRKEDTLVPATF